MATIIDSLIITLGLDNKQFKEKSKETDKTLEGLTKSAAKFLAVVGGTAAIKRFVEQQIEANAALARFAQNIDEGIEKISSWSKAAEIAGGSAQGLQGTLDMLSKAQTELQLTGQSGLIPFFSSLGISMTDAAGKSRPVTDMLLELSDRFKGMDRVTANNMGRMMGIDQGTMNLLLRGRSEVERMLKAQQGATAVTKKQAEESLKLNESITKVKQGFEAFGREMLSHAMPAIDKFFAGLENLLGWMRGNKDFVEAFFVVLTAGVAAFAVAAMPINLTVLSLLALAAAIAAVWQDYQVFKRGGEFFIPWDKWGPGINKAITGIKALKEIILDIFHVIADGGGAIHKFFTGDFSGAKDDARNFLFGRNKERQRFIDAAAEKLGVSPEIVDKHLKLETGGVGQSAIGQFNYGNIKAGKSWDGKTASRTVNEYDAQGREYKTNAEFRSYETPEQAAEDYARLLKNRYPGTANARTPEEFATALKKGGYATDPNYVSKFSGVKSDSMMGKVRQASPILGIAGAAGAAIGNSAASAISGTPQGKNEVKIDSIVIQTQATDAKGIAREIGGEIDSLMTSQFNTGLF